jgi:hypothetical protein
VAQAGGATVDIRIQRIETTSDLEKVLGVDAEASYGCGAFGAGVSARFSFAKNSKIQTSSLFMTVTAKVELAFLSIDDPALSSAAVEIFDRPDVFAEHYGSMFVRGIGRGGLFVGVLRIDTSSSKESEDISAALEGTYGLFSAKATTKFQEVQETHKSEIFIQMYHEGGPVDLTISNPQEPLQLVENASKFLQSFQSTPDQVARPYFVTIAPVTIAQGPPPMNAVDIQHAQDVIVFCAGQRSSMLDQLNLLTYIKDNQSKFDFSNGASVDALVKAVKDVQSDLDLVAACAGNAMDNPSEAKFPVDFAEGRGKSFPLTKMPEPMPQGAPKTPPPAAPPKSKELPPGMVKFNPWFLSSLTASSKRPGPNSNE